MLWQVLTPLQTAGFRKLGPQPRVPTPPPYKLSWVSAALPNMGFHNNKLVEISLDEPESKPSPPLPSRTSGGDFIKQEETVEKKRKRLEMSKFQTLHGQPAVDAARAADMDHIHFSEPFQGFDFPATNAFNRSAHFYGQTTYPPWPQSAGNSGTLYDTGLPDLNGISQSLSGDTLVPTSLATDPYAVSESVYDGGARAYQTGDGQAYQGRTHMSFPSNVDTIYHGNAEPFAVGSFAAELDESIQEEEVDKTFTQYDPHEEPQEEPQDEYTVSATHVEESDFAASESEHERPRKVPRLNKDGAPRKPRKPRAKLLKWSDDDWKNVCLGIVWACGEVGVQIPFDQAAQIVGEKCTAGALQQALLKLRGKQIAEGHFIPSLRMAWTRKHNLAASGAKTKAIQEPEANRPRKKPTRVASTQALLLTVRRAYNDRDRQGMASPYKWKKPPRKRTSSALQSPANIKEEDVPPVASTYVQPGGIHDDYGSGPQTPCHSNDFFLPTPTSHYGIGSNFGFLQGMDIAGGEFTNLLTTEGLHNLGNGLADASDDVFST